MWRRVMRMFKGTTPTHIFEIPMDTSLIKEVKITYSQKDEEKLVKRTKDCSLGECTISTRLSQEDTFRFTSNTFVTIQIRILTTSGDALACEPIITSVGKCLDDEVLV
jgi:hypothetical protein